ncbi:putative zinc-binding protein [Marinospirillum alkaliphilum]|uniref:Uncharacterized protein, contains metal-binding DGC domain n=1 Tax=Marinospirillum alkaliphilum DSM 21637 TaxID=1122209 RepID=A0A1K1ZLM1_9GAMM|nr:putative zinc-binding protein [Marinospirillum alkaliphilum]SFX75057.1 Uncharacterized protein, contains metal-binding DGC domain [Marinospirillum alkaliphilum DSM 21637]
MSDKNLPLVYSCSGCSDVAQLANTLALRLNQQGLAEMSCISGVGGKVPALVKAARSGRRILALDGCALQCSHACLQQVGVEPDLHVRLHEQGFRKHYDQLYSNEEQEQAWQVLLQILQDDEQC